MESLLQREAVYEGFTKIGESLSCSSCGHQYASEGEVPFKTNHAAPAIFSDADRSRKVELFTEDENECLCRRCAHYIINPFTQFCGIHKHEVQATDSCPQFQKRTEKDEDELDKLL